LSGRFETETSYDERYFGVASNVNYAQTTTSNSLTFELRKI
jgi:type IV secretory pathway protease TraF